MPENVKLSTGQGQTRAAAGMHKAKGGPSYVKAEALSHLTDTPKPGAQQPASDLAQEEKLGRLPYAIASPVAPEMTGRYPLLEELLRQVGLPLQGIYSYKDASRILGASVRTIQQWCRDGKLRSRNLPGRGRFLSEDLEEFLAGSLRPFEGNDI